MTRAKKKNGQPPLSYAGHGHGDDGNFKERWLFVPDGDDKVWRVVHSTCFGCGERFIQIDGQALGRDGLFTKLQPLVDEQMSEFVGTEEVKFRLELTAIPST